MEAAVSNDPTCTTARHVLLVEDDIGNSTFIKLLFETHGLSCTVAEMGSEALSMLASTKFDAVFLDLNLPDMDGFTLCQQAQASGLKDTPIIGLSAETSSATQSRCISEGMQDLVNKGMISERITEIIALHCH